MKTEIGFDGVRRVEDFTLTGENKQKAVQSLQNEITLEQWLNDGADRGNLRRCRRVDVMITAVWWWPTSITTAIMNVQVVVVVMQVVMVVVVKEVVVHWVVMRHRRRFVEVSHLGVVA